MAASTDDRPALLGGRALAPQPIRLTEPTLPALDQLQPDLEAMWARRQLANHGPLVTELASRLGEHCGVTVVPAASGTTALMAVLRTMGISGEVIVPAITFAATAHAVYWAGATPVIADVDPATWCLTPETIAARLTPRTEAVLAVHLFGPPCDVVALDAFAQRQALALVLDAAQAFGSTYPDGRAVGGAGPPEVFSFHATKILPAGEGGAIATGDPQLADELALTLRFGDAGDGVARRVALNGKMDEWSALLALRGLPDVPARIARRAELAARYWQGLDHLPGLGRQATLPGGRTNHQFLPILVDTQTFGLTTSRLKEALAAEGIDVRRHYYPPLHRQPAFALAGYPALPVADDVAQRALCLPLYSHQTDAEVDVVVAAIARCHRWREALGGA